MKKINSLCLSLIITIWAICLFAPKVSAATSASANFTGPSTAKVGDTVEVTLVVTESGSGSGEGIAGVQGPFAYDEKLELVSSKPLDLDVSYSSTSKKLIGMIGISDSPLVGKINIIKFTFKAKSVGEAKINLNLDISDADGNKIYSKTVSKTITITDGSGTTEPDNPGDSGDTGGTGDSGGTGDTGDNKKSSDATLKKLSVSGYTLSPTFDKNTTTYSMKVQNSVTGLNVTALPTDSKAKVEISGNKNWSVGVNVVTVKVTAEDGTVKTYTVNVTREAANTTTPTEPEENKKSSDNYLKNLIINSAHDITPSFNKYVTSYNVTVPNDVSKLDLTYITNDPKSKVTIVGNGNFKVGENNLVEIIVTAEDGSERVYVLNVNRSTEVSDTDLENLIVNGTSLNPKFSPDTLEYSVKVDSDTDKLDIEAIAKSKNAKVEIIGNENLKTGHNTVLVKVTDKNGFSKYYTIDVEKEAKKKTILGLTPLQFGIIAGIIGLLLLLLLWLLLLLLLRRKKEEPKVEKTTTPIIEIKPEFNIGSKNSSDDDVVHGNLNQSSTLTTGKEYEQLSSPKLIEADYEDSLPYDPYDEIVTKRELIDAIKEAKETKDASKLKMLLDQEALNQKKKEMKEKEERNKDEIDIDDWS